ncbi:FG-GAP repeat domain-containing protein [Spirosoma panaciterrae]|uniref:FG-GAP repeat domain-containing protein n=1 Tax=Spirosoma panaciterrae TaxID=496058 RepID=UPI00036C471D|nr:VCBS repeat-containing protein [Spirosoma panaciterrae]
MHLSYRYFLVTLFLIQGNIHIQGFAQHFINSIDSTTYQFFQTGRDPQGIILANLNNDIFPDLAISSRVDNSLSIRYNDQTGQFKSEITFSINGNPQSLAAADVNNDGRVDLITSNQNGTTSILLNTANGIIGISGNYPSTAGDASLAVADFNGDGWLDLVTAGGWGEYRILTNNRDGTFSSGQAVSMPEPVRSITVADFDGDSRPDLALVSGINNSIRLLRNLGNSTFTQFSQLQLSSVPFTIQAGDINLDGTPDLIVTSWSANQLIVLINTGQGQFKAPSTIGSVGLNLNIAIKDVSGDGVPDLLTPDAVHTYILVWRGRGDGTFERSIQYQVGAGPSRLAVEDINHDGWPDLAILNRDNSTATILLNRNQGLFGSANIIPAGANTSTLTDLDNDGYADLIGLTGDTTSVHGNALYIYRNQRDGTFAKPIYQAIGVQSNALTTGDVNNDGWNDLVSTNYNNNSISVMLNNRIGLFSSPVHYKTGPNCTEPVTSILADMNNDTYLDIVTRTNCSPASIALFINNRDGTFAEPVQYSQNYDSISDYIVSDINGDQKQDIAVLIFRSYPSRYSFIRFYLNAGDGTLSTPTDFTLSEEASSLVSLDFDADGRLDFLVGTYPGAKFLRNLGNGSFDSLKPILSGLMSVEAICDLNNDGLMDLLTLSTYYPTDNSKNVISIWFNTGNKGFSGPFELPIGYFESLAIGDVNHDGRPDILTGATNGMYLWYNWSQLLSWGITTIQPGLWNSPQTWSLNRLPVATDHVLIRHLIQLPTGYSANASRVGFDQSGQLHYNPNAQLHLQGYP